jgi:hypothetical protein
MSMCSGMSGTDLNHEGREDHEGNEKAPVFTEAGRKAFVLSVPSW